MKNRFREVRLSLNMTQPALAERLGLTQNYISLIETGQRNPSDRTITYMCRELGVNETWLRTGEGEMFVPRSQSEEVIEFLGGVAGLPPDSFKRKVILLLSRMTPEEWALMERKARELLAQQDEEQPETKSEGGA